MTITEAQRARYFGKQLPLIPGDRVTVTAVAADGHECPLTCVWMRVRRDLVAWYAVGHDHTTVTIPEGTVVPVAPPHREGSLSLLAYQGRWWAHGRCTSPVLLEWFAPVVDMPPAP